MENPKDLLIECPFCNGKLTVDPQNGVILHKEEAQKKVASFENFMENRKTHSQVLANKFSDAQEREKKRKEMLEKKFQWAKEHKNELPDARPDIHWE